ncbi:MAG: transforming growth factor-beta-induced protein [Planctomycetota bacterium]|jgi:transforming growth factor-beta-induced protein
MNFKNTAILSAVLAFGSTANAQNLVELAESTNRFNVLIAALEATGLDVVLEGSQDFTVFAPTDYAFYQSLGQAGIANLLANPEVLEQVLLYHVVPGLVPAADVVSSNYLTTVYDQRLSVELSAGSVLINNSLVQYTDLFATNGIVHVIDAPLLPNLSDLLETADEVGGFDTLIAAVGAAGLTPTLSSAGPFTVFAPIDAAFGALPTGTVDRLLIPGNQSILSNILQYHVVPGRFYADQVVTMSSLTTVNNLTLSVSVVGNDVFIDGAKILLPDVETSNGNIHVIDAVLIP